MYIYTIERGIEKKVEGSDLRQLSSRGQGSLTDFHTGHPKFDHLRYFFLDHHLRRIGYDDMERIIAMCLSVGQIIVLFNGFHDGSPPRLYRKSDNRGRSTPNRTAST